MGLHFWRNEYQTQSPSCSCTSSGPHWLIWARQPLSCHCPVPTRWSLQLCTWRWASPCHSESQPRWWWFPSTLRSTWSLCSGTLTRRCLHWGADSPWLQWGLASTCCPWCCRSWSTRSFSFLATHPCRWPSAVHQPETLGACTNNSRTLRTWL